MSKTLKNLAAHHEQELAEFEKAWQEKFDSARVSALDVIGKEYRVQKDELNSNHKSHWDDAFQKTNYPIKTALIHVAEFRKQEMEGTREGDINDEKTSKGERICWAIEVMDCAELLGDEEVMQAAQQFINEEMMKPPVEEFVAEIEEEQRDPWSDLSSTLASQKEPAGSQPAAKVSEGIRQNKLMDDTVSFTETDKSEKDDRYPDADDLKKDAKKTAQGAEPTRPLTL